MASLESLANPFERYAVLPQAVNFNINPITGDPTWDANRQYFQNDIVISGQDGGAYILNGNSTSYSGGVDPAFDAGNWQKTFPNGVSYYDTLVPTFTDAGAGAYTVSGSGLSGNTYLAPENTAWQVVWNGTATAASAPLLATDWVSMTLTPNGGGPVGATIDIVPRIGPTGATTSSTRFGNTAYVEVGSGGSGIAITGNYEASDAQAITSRLTFLRVF
jgi:hypothetical protein